MPDKKVTRKKRKPSGYNLFVRSEMKKHDVKGKGREELNKAMKAIGKKWTALTPASKEKWNSKAKRSRPAATKRKAPAKKKKAATKRKAPAKKKKAATKKKKAPAKKKKAATKKKKAPAKKKKATTKRKAPAKKKAAVKCKKDEVLKKSTGRCIKRNSEVGKRVLAAQKAARTRKRKKS